MIEVKNLVKRYGDFAAVDDLSFTVNDGEILGFLGPNGAGKSTTMNMITGYISATEGEVIIEGHNMFEEPEKAKQCIGYLPEIPPVYPDMRVREYLNFVADLRKVPSKERKAEVDRVMGLARVDHMQKKLIKHLSKGYRQRVGVAQALLGNPKVIILDEPTVGLDPMQISWMREFIRSLAKEHTVILSSHILFEVNAVCDRVLIINHGRKIIIDTPEQVIHTIGGTDGIYVAAKTTKEELDKILSGVEGISSTREERVPEEGVTACSVFPKEGADLREKIFMAFAAAGVTLLEMRSETKTLEEVFIALTGEEGTC
ncbi:MAG: ABC transporter ATP-binding protein [Lachnospiraceae bacterium]|nr:ABC transporter ATP-binding protein [Lachnospiraceae bacterium]